MYLTVREVLIYTVEDTSDIHLYSSTYVCIHIMQRYTCVWSFKHSPFVGAVSGEQPPLHNNDYHQIFDFLAFEQ